MRKMKVNRKLLKRVRDYLKKEPCGYDQSQWGAPSDNSCGTVCCIAGTALMLEDPKRYFSLLRADRREDIGEEGTQLLGLKMFGCNLLTTAENWPSRFRLKYFLNEGSNNRELKQQSRVRAAVARINYFLKTGK